MKGLGMSSESRPKILFVTAGLGGSSFEEAADRLVNQAQSFGLFDRLHAVKEEEVLEICPRLLEWFSLEELRSTKGFGWYTWKATIAFEAIVEKRWGQFDLVMYLDAGCEMFRSYFSQKRLDAYFNHANTSGNTLFAIPTPEIEYTKRDLFQYFPMISQLDSSNQFQSGSWVLKSDLSEDFVKAWEKLSAFGINMTDESPSILGEHSSFKVHRYDQSIFSLLAKSHGYLPVNETPPGNSISMRSKVRGFFFPFWWVRNRTGKSVIPRMLTKLGLLSARVLR